MTRTARKSNRLDRETKAYVLEKQGMFMQTLEAAWKHKKIDEVSYKRLSLDEFEGTTMDEAFDHYQSLFEELMDVAIDHEVQKIQHRILKGAEMIEKETDPIKRRQYMGVYEALLTELEALKQKKSA